MLKQLRWLVLCVLSCACEEAPSLVLEEFPPPHLAVTDSLSAEASRYAVSDGSQARLRLRRGRRTSAWTSVSVSGWVELAAVGLSSSGRLLVTPTDPLPAPDPDASAVGALRAIGPLQIEWDAAPDENDTGTVRTGVELNRHRSELPIALQRSRFDDGSGVRLVTREPAAIVLPDHAVHVRFESKNGERLAATQLEMQLDTQLVPR